MSSGGRMFNEHFFFSNKFVQSILGLRPDHSQKDQLFSVCAITFYIFPIIFHQLYQLFTSEVTLQSSVGVLQKLVATVGFIVVFSTTCFNFVTMKLLFTHMKSYFEHVSDEKELSKLEENIRQSKICVYVFFGVFNTYGILLITPCVVKACLYFLGILNDNKLSLILPVNNVSKAGAQYFCLLIYQIIAVIILVIVGVLSFSGYLLGVLFACYQFSILIFNIQYPFERNLIYMGKDCIFSTSQEEWDWVIDVIDRYKKVTEFVDLLNNFSSISYFVIVILAISVIAFDFLYIFQLSISLKNAVEIVECSFYIAGSILTLYINFYFGQELMNYSDVVFEELCQVPFYILSNKTQKFLLFMIGRSCKPSMLSIGGMFVSSNETFAAVMRKAFSFAMVYYSNYNS